MLFLLKERYRLMLFSTFYLTRVSSNFSGIIPNVINNIIHTIRAKFADKGVITD